MGFGELMARWRFLREGDQRQRSEQLYHHHRQQGADIRARSRGEH
jgi:hypothetical protein